MPAAAELAIRVARAAFNAALADGDLDAIAPLLAKNAILVTGTDSAVLLNRREQLATWKREFAAPVDDRILYIRTPESVIASTVEPIGLETGSWVGLTTTTRTPLFSGRYSAKWREVGGQWVIEAEIYVTLD